MRDALLFYVFRSGLLVHLDRLWDERNAKHKLTISVKRQ